MSETGSGSGSRRLLTFRLDRELRQRLRARLAREGRTMSEVVTHGLRQYVQHARGAVGPRGSLVLPERMAARLRELRSAGHSDLLSATLAALHQAGWPLRTLADALGISRQAVQARVRRARVRRRAAAGQGVGPGVGVGVGVGVGPGVGADLGAGLGLGDQVPECEPPPPFPHRRVASATGLRPHLTIKIDHTLRAAAHQAAADEGYSLSQVVETILDRYLEQGLGDQPVMRSTKIMRHASAASTGTPASKAP